MWWHFRQSLSCLIAFILTFIVFPLMIVLACNLVIVFAFYGNIDYDESGLKDALHNQCPALEIDISKGSFDFDPMINYYQQNVVSCYKWNSDELWECHCDNSLD